MHSPVKHVAVELAILKTKVAGTKSKSKSHFNVSWTMCKQNCEEQPANKWHCDMILLNPCRSLDDVDDVITGFETDRLGLPHFVLVKRFLIRSQIYNVVTFVLAKPNSS